MNQSFKEVFELVVMYYRYFHLGYFYSHLSKNEDLSCKSRDIWIDFDTNKFLLKGDIIKESLAEIYEKPQSPDFFSHLILKDSIRGITMSLYEALKDEEIEKLFLEHIFRNNKGDYDTFDEVVQFIRNTLSHNIRDRIELREKDYEKQMNRLREKGKSILNFSFDYARPPFSIRENYTIEINIDFNQIKDGVVYTDIISKYQNILFIELCYNCMVYLKDKWAEPSPNTA